MIHFKEMFFFKTCFMLLLADSLGVPSAKTQLLGAQNKAGGCDQDWYPCECIYYDPINEASTFIKCHKTTIIDVIEVFDRTEVAELTNFYLLNFVHDKGEGIPDNLTGNTMIRVLTIECEDAVPFYISENAFYSSKGYSTDFTLKGCNLNNSSMGFLEGFSEVSIITIEANPNISLVFPSFPVHLPKLATLDIPNSIGWNWLTKSPKPLEAEKLTKFYLTGSLDMTDEAMDIVMNWAVQSFNLTLEQISLFSNKLTRIPRQIQYFDKLSYLDLGDNIFGLVLSHSLVMKADEVFLVSLPNCNIYELQPDAFQGNFKNTLIELQRNKLTRIESSVFQKILRDQGTIDVQGNPFDCEDDPCHLAWIFNENLLNLVKNAKCSNGTVFSDLDPSFFADCKIYTTTESSLTTDISTQRTTHNEISFTYSFNWSSSSKIDEPLTFSTEGNWYLTHETTPPSDPIPTYLETTSNQETSGSAVSLTTSSLLSPTNHSPGTYPRILTSEITIFTVFICLFF